MGKKKIKEQKPILTASMPNLKYQAKALLSYNVKIVRLNVSMKNY